MTVTPWIADVSFGHDATPGATLKAAGCVGVIGYAGCDDTRKNCTPANLEDWQAHGLPVGLVIENGEQDLLGGQKAGAYLGQRLAAAARTLGYDLARFVGYTSGDWNSQGAQLDTIDLAMQAFGDYVGVPGYYGNSYAIDRVTGAGHARFGWQSDSASFSYGPSPRAHLLQRWADPRAAGLQVDASDIQHVPLGLMGEPTTTTTANGEAMFEIIYVDGKTGMYAWSPGGGFWHIPNPDYVKALQASKLCAGAGPVSQATFDACHALATSASDPTQGYVNAAAAAVEKQVGDNLAGTIQRVVQDLAVDQSIQQAVTAVQAQIAKLQIAPVDPTAVAQAIIAHLAVKVAAV